MDSCSILFKWLDLHWMRCQILVHLQELHPHFVTSFRETDKPNSLLNLADIICIFRMLVRGLLGALHT